MSKKKPVSELGRDMAQALRLEIKAREELVRRLGHPLKLLESASEKEQKKRAERIERLTGYESYQDAQDAFGWGDITEEKFDDIIRAMEKGTERLEKERAPIEVAKDILADFIGSLLQEASSLRYELLPEEEKARVREQSMEFLERRSVQLRAIDRGDVGEGEIHTQNGNAD